MKHMIDLEPRRIYPLLEDLQMTPDQKLQQAQDDLRRAERAVQEARDELAKEKVSKFTEADVVPGARFWSPTYKTHITIVEQGYHRMSQDKKYGITGNGGDPCRWYSNGPFTLTEMVDWLNDPSSKHERTPGEWVFQPEDGCA